MDVDARLDSCCERWGLRLDERLAGGFSAEVLACRDERGRERVLKLPRTRFEADTEVSALRAWAGNGAVALVDFAPDLAALLLVRLVPGTPLPAGDDDRAVAAVADVLAALHAVDVGSADVPAMPLALDQHLANTIAHAEPDTAGLALLDVSRDAAMSLCATTRSNVLLHGDPLDKNLLFDGRSFVAIDPIPRIGDPCSDVGFFSAGRVPCTNIVGRAERLADSLRLDAHRAARWAAIWAVGEACETWRPDSDELQRWITGPEAAALLAS